MEYIRRQESESGILREAVAGSQEVELKYHWCRMGLEDGRNI